MGKHLPPAVYLRVGFDREVLPPVDRTKAEFVLENLDLDSIAHTPFKRKAETIEITVNRLIRGERPKSWY